MTNDKSIFLMVCATNQCNRGCKHCMVRSDVNGTVKGSSFAKGSWVKKLVREAKGLGYKLTGMVSGLGEPLMNPMVVELTKGFTGQGICRRIDFLTSGFLRNDLEERERFQSLVKLPINLHFNFSFNLYSPTFSERLQETMGLLFQQKKVTFSDIHIVCDRKNYYLTFEELWDTLSCMEVKLGMKILPLMFNHESARFQTAVEAFLRQEYSQEDEIQLIGDALFIPYIYSIENKKYGRKYFRMDPGLTQQVGAANSLSDSCFFDEPYNCPVLYREKEDDVALYMDPEGNMFPACNCILSGLKIGTWKTPLSKLIARRQMLRNNLMKLLMADHSVNWGKFPCNECATLVKRHFSFD